MNFNYSTRSGCIIGIFFRIRSKNVCCVFSLESSHRGDSEEYTQYTIFNIKKENYPESAAMCFSKGLKNEFKTVVVNEASMFGPLKVCCIQNTSTI